jgi:hypothetical protein
MHRQPLKRSRDHSNRLSPRPRVRDLAQRNYAGVLFVLCQKD